MEHKVHTYIYLHLIKGKPSNSKISKDQENFVTLRGKSIKFLNLLNKYVLEDFKNVFLKKLGHTYTNLQLNTNQLISKF